jgi:hypothetical protein
MPDPERGSKGKLHCPTCKDSTGPATRAGLHCGWMDRKEWTPGRDGLPASFGDEPYTADVCPGWLMYHPEVIAGAQAADAYEQNALHLYDPRGSNVTYELAQLGRRSLNLYRAHTERTRQARMAAGVRR